MKKEGERGGVFAPGDKRLPLDGEETDLAYRKTAVYKGKGGNPVLG